jgi:hypothetical protein
MPELGPLLVALTAALEELRETEAAHDEARERCRQALNAARAAGASYALLGRHVGLSSGGSPGLT